MQDGSQIMYGQWLQMGLQFETHVLFN